MGKRLQLKSAAVQRRRIRCVHCGRTFWFLQSSLVFADVDATYSDGQESLRAEVASQLAKAATASDSTAAPCAHCYQLQPSMVEMVIGHRAMGWVGGPIAVAGLVGLFLAIREDYLELGWLTWIEGAAVAGAGIWLGYLARGVFRSVLTPAPGPRSQVEQRLSLSEEGLMTLASAAEQQDTTPEALWYEGVKDQLRTLRVMGAGQKPPMVLPPLDRVGKGVVQADAGQRAGLPGSAASPQRSKPPAKPQRPLPVRLTRAVGAFFVGAFGKADTAAQQAEVQADLLRFMETVTPEEMEVIKVLAGFMWKEKGETPVAAFQKAMHFCWALHRKDGFVPRSMAQRCQDEATLWAMALGPEAADFGVICMKIALGPGSVSGPIARGGA